MEELDVYNLLKSEKKEAFSIGLTQLAATALKTLDDLILDSFDLAKVDKMSHLQMEKYKDWRQSITGLLLDRIV